VEPLFLAAAVVLVPLCIWPVVEVILYLLGR
jgi:hypothetical protein